MPRLIYILLFVISSCTCVASGVNGYYRESTAWGICTILLYILLTKENEN